MTNVPGYVGRRHKPAYKRCVPKCTPFLKIGIDARTTGLQEKTGIDAKTRRKHTTLAKQNDISFWYVELVLSRKTVLERKGVGRCAKSQFPQGSSFQKSTTVRTQKRSIFVCVIKTPSTPLEHSGVDLRRVIQVITWSPDHARKGNSCWFVFVATKQSERTGVRDLPLAR